ncbi:MAG: peptide chain release factor N(5)-glutamine methyltransferase [Ruminococcus sp.]|jgi:release factor glutamine methyltransferase|nr:peptide chain release factor N(5)-glutamine methyltransferase [Ruminococcus sp.]
MLYKEILPYIEKKLKGGGINPDDIKTEAQIIADDIGGLTLAAITVNPDKEILPGKLTAMEKVINTRVFDRVPLQYLVPLWDWYGIKLKLADGVLCPRQETELLIDIISDKMEEKSFDSPLILDLCTGSGNIAIMLKKLFPKSTVYAVENSPMAVPMFKFNCKYNETEINFVQGNVMEQTTLAKFHDEVGTPLLFDIVVSNPPYLTKIEMNTLQPELKHEPEVALYGGFDGLDFYRVIPVLYKDYIKEGGLLIFEIGQEQGKDVRRIMNKAGYKDIKVVRDLGDNDRAVLGIK